MRGGRWLTRVLMMTPKPLVWRFARTYIAGETLDDAMKTLEELETEGCRSTLDVLGESVTKESEVEAYVDEYLQAVDAIAASGIEANVSIKPTAMGLTLSDDMAYAAVSRILDRARSHGMNARMDMEDSSVTQSTLDLYRRLRDNGYDNVGVVLQAYLRRTLPDARDMAGIGASVRVCKGIYVEPRSLAYQDFWVIRHAFVDALKALFARPDTFVAIATHDEWLVLAARRLLADLGIPRERYEFQMLLGVDAQLRRLIVAEGHPMRIYVPYGTGWYAYSVRRLVENPRLAGHVVRNVLGFGPGRESNS